MTPVLLFDVMDTLVRDPFHDVIPAFFGLTLAELLEQKHPTAWIDFERGVRSPADYYASMFLDERVFDGRLLERRVEAAYRWMEGMQRLLQDLGERGIEMHALSNYPIWYELVERRLGLSRFVKWSFVSCRTGIRKPDPEAYLGAARTLGRTPSECLFIDDREQNCAAARAVGMPAIRFRSVVELVEELRALGLPIAPR